MPVPGTRRDVASAQRWVTARRWATGLLALATVGLVGYLTLLVVAVSMAAWAVEVVKPGTVDGTVDLAGLAADALPGVFVGWCLGLAATAGLANGDTLGPRTAGALGATLGVVVGALVLRFTGLL